MYIESFYIYQTDSQALVTFFCSYNIQAILLQNQDLTFDELLRKRGLQFFLRKDMCQ